MPGSRGKALPYVAAILTVIGFAPLVLAAASAAIANTLGCRLDEGSVHPCPAFGMDIGEQLYRGGMMMWLFFATAPIALLAVILWVVLAARLLVGTFKVRNG